MKRAEGLIWAWPLAGALLLAGCGGGSEQAAERQAVDTIAIDTSKFIAQAQDPSCADVRNRLFLIDRQYVFADRAGSCADAAYSYRLYGKTTDALLCSNEDSIAGPRIACSDATAKALFEVMIKNLGASDLGLGSTHRVEKVDFVMLHPPFHQIDRLSTGDLLGLGARGTALHANLVIRDAITWTKVWNAYASGKPVPAIDFSTDMVLLAARTFALSCYTLDIAELTRKDGKLVVTVNEPGMHPLEECSPSLVHLNHMVRTARVDDPVEFVTPVGSIPQ